MHDILYTYGLLFYVLYFFRFPISSPSSTGSGSFTRQQQQQSHSVIVPGIIPKGSKDAILNSIVETYHNQEPLKLKNKNKKALRKYSKFLNLLQ